MPSFSIRAVVDRSPAARRLSRRASGPRLRTGPAGAAEDRRPVPRRRLPERVDARWRLHYEGEAGLDRQAKGFRPGAAGRERSRMPLSSSHWRWAPRFSPRFRSYDTTAFPCRRPAIDNAAGTARGRPPPENVWRRRQRDPRRRRPPHGLERQEELALRPLRRERGQGEAQKPNALRDRKERFEQGLAEPFELASGLDLPLSGAAAGDLSEIGKLDLQRNRASAKTVALAIPPELVDDFLQCGARGPVGEQIGGKRGLGAEGLAPPIGPHRPLVDAARHPIIVRPRFPEMPLQESQGLRLEVKPGLDPEPLHLGGGGGPYAGELPDRQGLDESRPHPGGDDEQPVRLAVIRGELGEKLVVGDAGRGRQAGFGADPGPDLFGDFGRRGDALEVFCNVEIGLIERQWLDERRVFGEDPADLKRDRPIDLKARFDEDQIRASALGRERGHRGADAELARFIAGGGDHPALPRSADRDRLAAQLRIVALFDRGVEGIHVDMDDLARSDRRGRGERPALCGTSSRPIPIGVRRRHDPWAATEYGRARCPSAAHSADRRIKASCYARRPRNGMTVRAALGEELEGGAGRSGRAPA